MKKRVISFALCVILIVTLCTPVFAVESIGKEVTFGDTSYIMYMIENGTARTLILDGDQKDYRLVYEMNENRILVYVNEESALYAENVESENSIPYKVIDLNNHYESEPMASAITYYASDTVKGAYFYVHWDDGSYELLCNSNPKAYTDTNPNVTIRDYCRNYYSHIKQLDNDLVSVVDYIEAFAAEHTVPHFSPSLCESICTIFNDSATSEEDTEAYGTIAISAISLYTGWTWLPDIMLIAEYVFKQACVKEDVDQLVKIYTYVYNWYN